MPAAIKFSNERIMMVLIEANMKKHCKIAAKLILKLSKEG